MWAVLRGGVRRVVRVGGRDDSPLLGGAGLPGWSVPDGQWGAGGGLDGRAQDRASQQEDGTIRVLTVTTHSEERS
ncbi:hypothetical protein GCM10009546_01930 [Actinomadura livida]|uniref:Uncharacterized protein n=1 Tax=Actinomadura livida TaxID=79909 RepID=A0ABN1DH51_9ACTN|nr:hypothetical protein GCM10010208_28170 [Actinomadura livida]